MAELRVEINREASARDGLKTRLYLLDPRPDAGAYLPLHERHQVLGDETYLNGTDLLSPELASTNSFECEFQTKGGTLSTRINNNLTCTLPSQMPSLVDGCESVGVAIIFRNEGGAPTRLFQILNEFMYCSETPRILQV